MATGKRTKIVLTLAAAAMAILALATPSPGAVLKVDFNSTNQDGGPHNQADWSAYDAGHEVAADFNTKPYDGITVTPTWPNTTAATVQQMIDRGSGNDANWNDAAGDLNLVTDFIGTDTRTANGGNGNWNGTTGTPTYLDLTLGGLPAGDYGWTSFHQDTEHCHGTFAVWLSTDGGATFTRLADGLMTDSTPGGTPDSAVDGSYGLVTGPDAYTLPSTYHTSFIANGTDDVVLRFAMYAGAITNEVHNQIFAMNGFELVSLIAAHTPDPANEETGVALDLSDRVRVPGHLSWLAPTSSTITQILGYDLYLDPNETFVANRESFCLIAQTGLANTVTQYDPADFDWGVTYHWVVDVHYKTGGPTDPNVYVGEIDPPWWFRAIGAGPEVDAGDDLVTALEFLPANLAGTVTDATNDVASVAWSIAGYPGDPVAAVMQMIDRGGNDNSAIPDLLRDWIGSDTRSPGDPLILTLSGLPAGDYTWTSYHHDPENQTGQFDATVMDATGSTTTLNIDITDRNLADPNAFTRFIAPIVSDGSDVRLVFHQRASTPTEYAFFVMNGFHLMDDEGGLMNIDFGQPTTPVKAGYQAYLASHEVPATFTPQDFSAFGATVTISVAWGPHALGLINASVTKTNADLYAPTADFTTDYAGTYVIQLEATDSEGSVGSDTLEVAVAEEPCTAAQMVSTWPGFNYYDRDEDCDVDMLDFVPFASQWLEDRSLTGQVED